MTDQEIFNAFCAAEDKKQAVKTLAEENGVGIWDMMQRLTDIKAPGLDKRWYQDQNPARKKPITDGSTDPAYLKKIIAQQDKIMKEQHATIEKLTTEICKTEDEVRALTDELNAKKAEKPVAGKMDLIAAFCTGMSGTAAWLMGRFVELLLQWKEFGDASELRDFLAEYYEQEETL